MNRRKISFQVGNASCLAVRSIPIGIATQTKGEGVKLWKSSDVFKKEYQYDYVYLGFCHIEISFYKHCIFLPAENADVKALDLQSLTITHTFSSSPKNVGEVMILKCTKYCCKEILLTAYESGDIYLWDSTKGVQISCFKLDNVPMALDFDEENGKGICGTEADSAIVFNIDKDFNFSFEKSLLMKNPGVSSVTIRGDKKICVLGCWDGNLRVYSWKSGRILGVLSEHTETVNALAYSSKPVGMWRSIILAAASKDKTVSLWSFY